MGRGRKTALILAGALLAGSLLVSGCGTTPLGTRSMEEKWFGMGYSRELMVHGQDLLNEGRYNEAMAAFREAELMAYTNDIRRQARYRRMWLEWAMARMEAGYSLPVPQD